MLHNRDDNVDCPVLLSGHSGWVTCLDLTTDGSRVVSGSKDQEVKVWDTKTGGLLLSLEQDSEITCLCLYPLIPGQTDLWLRWDYSC